MDADVRFLSFFPPAEDALASLPTNAATWFRETVGAPTAVQRGAWPILSRGQSVLVSAPTGTGKTLAGFLPLLTRVVPVDGIIGIAIAPLKSLVVDQVKNISAIGLFSDLRLAIRTGDTSASARRQHKLVPPHVLWTTPESLAVMLTQDDFRRHIAELRWVVVDEIHALAASKRGVDLSLSLERLEELTRHGPLQRVGLSATSEPLEPMAKFLVGTHRSCEVVNVAPTPNFQIAIEPLPTSTPLGVNAGFIGRLVERLLPELDAHRTTLIFANTRNVCERIGYALKKRLPECAERLATHHSSLAALRRREIEADLKAGKLMAVVSSASLELGIDIGSVDAVVFVHPPGGVARLLQRLGRAGHRPGVLKKGLMLCSHATEILEAGVTASAGKLHQLEPVAIPNSPLDVLCQQLIGMAIGRAWTSADALALVRRAYAFRHLTDDDFEACVRYLRGRKSDDSDWLPSRLDLVESGYTVTSRKMARLLSRNLGTIQTEEPRLVRTEGDDGYIIGELDDSYAKNLQAGDRFLLDGRCLTLHKSTAREMIVRETPGSPLVPRWHGGFVRIPEALARRLFWLRAEAAETLRDGPPALLDYLANELGLGRRAADELADFLHAQEAASEVPGGRTTLVEIVDRGIGFEYALHTPLHTAGNEALARVLQHRFLRDFGGKVFSVAVTLGVLLFHETETPLDELAWRRLTEGMTFTADLEGLMRTSDLTRMRFADIAHTGLMVLRQPIGGPRNVGGRDWIERRLFDQIHDADPEFALLRQARREAMHVSCDAGTAQRCLDDMATRPLRLRQLFETSPFASAWLDKGEEAAHKKWHEAG